MTLNIFCSHVLKRVGTDQIRFYLTQYFQSLKVSILHLQHFPVQTSHNSSAQ